MAVADELRLLELRCQVHSLNLLLQDMSTLFKQQFAQFVLNVSLQPDTQQALAQAGGLQALLYLLEDRESGGALVAEKALCALYNILQSNPDAARQLLEQPTAITLILRHLEQQHSNSQYLCACIISRACQAVPAAFAPRMSSLTPQLQSALLRAATGACLSFSFGSVEHLRDTHLVAACSLAGCNSGSSGGSRPLTLPTPDAPVVQKLVQLLASTHDDKLQDSLLTIMRCLASQVHSQVLLLQAGVLAVLSRLLSRPACSTRAAIMLKGLAVSQPAGSYQWSSTEFEALLQVRAHGLTALHALTGLHACGVTGLHACAQTGLHACALTGLHACALTCLHACALTGCVNRPARICADRLVRHSSSSSKGVQE